MATVWMRLRADMRVGGGACSGWRCSRAGRGRRHHGRGRRAAHRHRLPAAAFLGGRRQATVHLGGLDPAYFAALHQLPQVAAVATAMQYNIALTVPGGLPDNQVEVLASFDGSLGTTVDRVRLLEGGLDVRTWPVKP